MSTVNYVLSHVKIAYLQNMKRRADALWLSHLGILCISCFSDFLSWRTYNQRRFYVEVSCNSKDAATKETGLSGNPPTKIYKVNNRKEGISKLSPN